MTREEALTRLRLRSHQAFCEYVENGNQENEEAALDVLAYDTAIAALRGPEWVRTADRLPEAADGITGATGEPEVLTICEHAHGWFPEVIRVSKVVRMPKYYWYWMPLPEPPGVEGEG